MRDNNSGPISVTVARTGWPCSPKTSQNIGRKLVGLEAEAHIGGPLEDKILGFPDFGDARQVSLDIGGEHRNAGTRKSLGHHLQRDGFSGSGSTGDEAMAIGKPERQPGRLLALADKDLLVGIRRLGIGCRHSHRLVARIRGRSRQRQPLYRILQAD